MPEGAESPPPERQTGKQLHDPPGEGFGTTEVGKKGEEMKSELENLSSNPKGPMDDSLQDKFSKEKGNSVGARTQ
ncbi:hypothetical protein NOR_01105 [Metarhizium rileyi]|uniref:Uncharacterized protein n=1 Tax=Metarhizium rileyi (strain RCEF 4871) TaxID=1649241 RepID=A0A162I0C2_METRR|nr:hypothetical protein NOR_01105 [Metarhizium rileyi RCEF 4871]TWU76004.1 hypothetical protein ED733_007113 [Metarhizium rileyi]